MSDHWKKLALYTFLVLLFGITAIVSFASFDMADEPPLEFECGNGKKIPGEWVNDGATDCNDGSDEKWEPENKPFLLISTIISAILSIIFIVKTKKQSGTYNRIVAKETKEKLKALQKDRLEMEEAMRKAEEAGREADLLNKLNIARRQEKLLEFEEAAETYKELGMDNEVIRIRKLKAKQGAVKVDQTVVHGDQVTKTEIKDSVLNRSNVGGGSSKAEEIKEIKELLDSGAIDGDEFKQMKKEILGK